MQFSYFLMKFYCTIFMIYSAINSSPYLERFFQKLLIFTLTCFDRYRSNLLQVNVYIKPFYGYTEKNTFRNTNDTMSLSRFN